ncbi:MAG: Uridylate kinase [Candidatus Heimdallarchaeota archaeon AB_125]|nr:MAG: Uridylate kinase [Candidatus Heimdallarchaeota archaeon AB_125]
MKKIVIKFGGSVLYKEEMILNVEKINEIVDTIITLHDAGHKVAIVVGGGKLARIIIQASDVLGHVTTFKDILAVESTRIHALLVIASLKNRAYLLVPRSFEEVGKALSSGKIVVTGGLQPGQSTNAVASLVAEYWGADLLINLTNVDKVYDKDPNQYDDAKPLDEISADKLLEIISQQDEEPGKYALFDRVGCEIVKRSALRLIFINGSEPKNILRIVNGEKIGTIVQG